MLDNEHYGETGMQATHTQFGVDLAAMAKGAGFARTFNITAQKDIARLKAAIDAGRGPLFAQVKVDPEKLPLVLPPREASYIKNRMRVSILGPEALHQ